MVMLLVPLNITLTQMLRIFVSYYFNTRVCGALSIAVSLKLKYLPATRNDFPLESRKKLFLILIVNLPFFLLFVVYEGVLFLSSVKATVL